MKQFRSDYGVYTCEHVFEDKRPVLLVIRDPEGDWQFLCGQEDDKQCHLIGVGHLLNRDHSLAKMVELKVGTIAERVSIDHDWEYFDLDD